MATYKDSSEAKELLDEMFKRILDIDESNKQFSATKAVLGVYYKDPDYFIAIDGTQSPTVLAFDEATAPKSDIEIRMSSETANTFWKGELNFPVAMMKGKVKIKGPAATVTKLLPAVAPGHDIYKGLLKEKGKDHLS